MLNYFEQPQSHFTVVPYISTLTWKKKKGKLFNNM